MGIAYALSLQWDAQERVLLRVWCGTGKRKSVPHNKHSVATLKHREDQLKQNIVYKSNSSDFFFRTRWKQEAGSKRRHCKSTEVRPIVLLS